MSSSSSSSFVTPPKKGKSTGAAKAAGGGLTKNLSPPGKSLAEILVNVGNKTPEKRVKTTKAHMVSIIFNGECVAVIMYSVYGVAAFVNGAVSWKDTDDMAIFPMKIMYRNVRDRLLAEFDVQNPPYLKNFVQPLYFAIAFEPDDEIMAAQVAQLAEFKEQIRRLLPGSPDTSNNSVYELVEVDVEANEELIAALAVFKSTFQ
jgi:hypothetical protein